MGKQYSGFRGSGHCGLQKAAFHGKCAEALLCPLAVYQIQYTVSHIVIAGACDGYLFQFAESAVPKGLQVGIICMNDCLFRKCNGIHIYYTCRERDLRKRRAAHKTVSVNMGHSLSEFHVFQIAVIKESLKRDLFQARC